MRLRTLPDAVAGLLIACAAAVIINLPLWHGLVFTGERERPDVVTESTDEKFYLARINEVADGHFWAGHPFLYERRDQRYPLGNLWEAVLGLPMRWLDLEIKTVSTTADAVFPFLLVFILWVATRHVLPAYRWRALLIGILFLGFEMHWWKRPISPQATTILPLLYLWAAFTPRRAELVPTALRGALIGLMTLSYPFHWTFCLAAEGLLTFVHLARDPHWHARTKRIGALVVPLVLCALPWVIMMLWIQGDAAYAQTLERLGFLDRRLPAGLPLQAMVAAAIACVLLMRKRASHPRVAGVLLVLLLASLAVLNQPLITGKEAEFSSHYRQIIFFPLWISILWALHAAVARSRILLLAVPMVGLLIIGIRTAQSLDAQWTYYEAARLETNTRTRTNALMATLNELSGEQVILADRETALDMAVYTAHYPFFAYETHMYLMDNGELWKRAAIQQTLFPEQPILPRSVAGSSFLNRALHARTVCRIRALFSAEEISCDIPAESYLPARWHTLGTPAPAQEEILSMLREAGTDYALMRAVPGWLRPHGETLSRTHGYELFRFDWSRP